MHDNRRRPRYPHPMKLRIATWNINSLRLRFPLLEQLRDALDPDIICLQETKVPDALFPDDAPAPLGYPHIARRGMKGYNGVAILSRLPIEPDELAPDWCAKGDCRHIAVRVQAPSGPVELHDFYVPAGGDIADPGAEPEIRPQARLRHRSRQLVHRPPRRTRRPGRRPQHRPARARRLEPQAAPHRRQPHPGRGRAHAGLARRRIRRRHAALRSRPRRSSTPGGPTATATGACPTAAAGSTTSGSRPTSSRPCAASPC